MSWSVSASGKPQDVMGEIHRQLWAGPLADKPAGLSDDGERETVRQVSGTINQCLETFDPERNVLVSANGTDTRACLFWTAYAPAARAACGVGYPAAQCQVNGHIHMRFTNWETKPALASP